MSKVTNGITIFLESGKTFTFLDTKIENDNEAFLTFSYTSQRDGSRKTVKFAHSRIVGFSQF